MNIMELGALGEFVGAVAVVVTLGYLALQVRQSKSALDINSQETRAATMQATIESEMFFQSQMLRHARTWEKIITGQPLSEGEEKREGILLFNMLMTLNDNRFHQVNSGFMDHKLSLPVAFQFYDVWRESGGASDRSAEFLALADSQRARLVQP